MPNRKELKMYSTISLVVSVIGLVAIFCFLISLRNYRVNGSSVVPSIVSFLLLFSCLIGIFVISEVEKQKFYSDVETKLDNGYVLYVDGEETDPKHIDLKKYDISSFTIKDNMILIAR